MSGGTQSSAPDALPTSGAAAKDTAERRQVTVMFSDLVGSTALSARMDPEDLREVISAYHKCAAETVRRFGGFVSQYLGDGVLVYFGYPQAHEDDAERAVRAGLELVAAVSDLKTHAALQARVGIATGLVVVGDLMDAGMRKNAASLARRRTWQHGCKGSPRRIAWSLPKVREGCSATCSNLKTLGQRNSKVSQAPSEPLPRYDRLR